MVRWASRLALVMALARSVAAQAGVNATAGMPGASRCYPPCQPTYPIRGRSGHASAPQPSTLCAHRWVNHDGGHVWTTATRRLVRVAAVGSSKR